MAKKNIMMVGVFDVKGSTNIEMAEGFRSLGHSVEEYNYRTRLKELGCVDRMHMDFLGLINGRKFDLQVFCKVNQMHPRMLQYARDSGPTWYWFMDNFEVCRQMNAASYAANATFASATASDVTERFKLLNHNAYHIFEGYNPELYYWEDSRIIHDFLFIGNATVPRIIEIQELIRSGMKISIFGEGWPIGMQVSGPVFGEDERIEINSANVVINLCHDDVIFSDRVIKALACGASVMSYNSKDFREMVAGMIIHPDDAQHVRNSKLKWLVVSNGTKHLTIQESTVFTPRLDMKTHMRHHHSWKAVCAGMMEKVSVHEGSIR